MRVLNLVLCLILAGLIITTKLCAIEKPKITDCVTDKDTKKTTCHAVIKYPNITYEGQLVLSNCKIDEKKNNICNANFKATNNLIDFEGQLVNYLPEGKASIKYGNGDLFEGEITQGGLILDGKYYLKTGEVWIGKIQNSKIVGKGIYVFKNGDRFEGDFNGKGVTSSVKGIVVKGEYKNFKPFNAVVIKDRNIRGLIIEGSLEPILISENDKIVLEKKFRKYCAKADKEETPKYYKCLDVQAKKEVEAIKLKEKLAFEKKIKEQQELIAKEKNELEKKQQENQKLKTTLANMTPDERRAYICNKVYGFSTWGINYKDCVLKLVSVDNEKLRVEEQKRLAAEQIASRERIAEAERVQRQQIAEQEAYERQLQYEREKQYQAEEQAKREKAEYYEGLTRMFNAIGNYRFPSQRMQDEAARQPQIYINNGPTQCTSQVFGNILHTQCQ